MSNKPQRAVGVIISRNRIILMRRIKFDREYFVFPGGGVNSNESEINAVAREMKEELNLDCEPDRELFKIFNKGRKETYFLINKFKGDIEVVGEEKDRSNVDNQYHPGWYKIDSLPKIDNLHPEEAKNKIITLWKNKRL